MKVYSGGPPIAAEIDSNNGRSSHVDKPIALEIAYCDD
jgi:hypothetical protein